MTLPLMFLLCLLLFSCLGIYGLQAEMTGKLADQAVRAAADLTDAAAGVISPVHEERFEPGIVTFGIPMPQLRAAVRVHPWNGDDGDWCGRFAPGEGSAAVFVSDNHSVYHTDSSCSYLEIHIQAVRLEEAKRRLNAFGEHYRRCELCCGEGADDHSVYITGAGGKYHASGTCSGLKRSGHMITLEEAREEGLPLCSRCDGHLH